jgi:hypothetical protein
MRVSRQAASDSIGNYAYDLPRQVALRGCCDFTYNLNNEDRSYYGDKMNSLASFLCIDHPCDQALDWLTRSLAGEGLRVLPTFDLHNARIGPGECPCPHHGTAECDCQMVVVLVYGEAEHPATLFLHGSDGQTWFSLINTPVQHADARIQSAIEHALGSNPLV